ncbi:MAG: KOW domain-containing RNA-binding protein [Clostridiales bacterium]|nr:KOW domain-containing RNA-binding protein [Clostridiales bacterium]
MTWDKENIRLATSMAGHDKGEIFVIVGEEEEYVYLADGKSRSVTLPKRKNRKHIQIIGKIPEDVLEVLTKRIPPDDVAVKRALKLYKRALSCEQ